MFQAWRKQGLSQAGFLNVICLMKILAHSASLLKGDLANDLQYNSVRLIRLLDSLNANLPSCCYNFMAENNVYITGSIALPNATQLAFHG